MNVNNVNEPSNQSDSSKVKIDFKKLEPVDFEMLCKGFIEKNNAESKPKKQEAKPDKLGFFSRPLDDAEWQVQMLLDKNKDKAQQDKILCKGCKALVLSVDKEGLCPTCAGKKVTEVKSPADNIKISGAIINGIMPKGPGKD